MAKIDYITLMNLPINNSYENVYDSKTKLLSLANPLSTPLPESSVKKIYFNKDLGFNFDKNTTLTLSKNDITDNLNIFNKFNYLVISLSGQFEQNILLYFITNYEINNSGDVVTLFLEYDEWHNNVDEFYEKNKDREQYFDRLTYDGYKKLPFLAPTYTYDGYIKDENLQISTKQTVIPSKSKRLLWMKLTTVYNSNLGVGKPQPLLTLASANSALAPLQVWYIPYAIINEDDTVRYKKVEIKAVDYDEHPTGGGGYSTDKWIILGELGSQEFFNTFNKLDSIIIKKEFTFNAPYRFNYVIKEPAEEDKLEFEYVEFPRDAGNDYVAFTHIRYLNTSGEEPSVVSLQTSFFFFGTTNYTYNQTETVDNTYYLDFMPNTNPLYLEKTDIQARLHYYPFNYKTMFFSNKKFDLIPYQKAQKHKFILENDTIKPKALMESLLLDENNEVITKDVITPITGNGVMPIVNDRLINYEMNNANYNSYILQSAEIKFALKQMANSVRTSTNLGTSTVNVTKPEHLPKFAGNFIKESADFGIKTVENMTEYALTNMGIEASYADARNAIDETRVSETSAFGDYSYQDSIRFFENTIANKQDIFTTAEFFEKFGIKYLGYSNLSKPNFHKFDYYKIPNPDFLMTNFSTLNTIKNIFIRGVRIWHLSNFRFENEFYKDCINLSYEVTNVPMSIIEGEEISL